MISPKLSLASMLALLSLGASAENFGTVLFTAGNVEIVDAAGNARLAKRGDVVQSGERIRSGDNGVAQVRAWDGSFVGVRPTSDVAVQATPGVGGQSTVALERGAVRLLNSDLNDGRKRAAMALKTASETIMMKAADLESAVVAGKSGDGKSGMPESGSYTRVDKGAATLLTAASSAPVELPLRQVSFVPLGGTTLQVATITPSILTSTLIAPTLTLATVDPVKTTTTLSPTLTTSTLLSSSSLSTLDTTKLYTTSPTTTTSLSSSTLLSSSSLSSTSLTSSTLSSTSLTTTKVTYPIVTKTTIYSTTGTRLLTLQ